jgi:hypothetical protein
LVKPEAKKPFNRRAFAALAACVSGLGLPVTGYMNHLYQFSPMTPARHAWMMAHNLLGVLFVIFALWHAVLNRRALAGYLRGGMKRLRGISREAALAFLLVAGLLLFFVGISFHAR